LRPRFESFEEAVRETLASLLVSPHFLYLVEPRSKAKGRQTLNDHELAARISYLLWSTMPDDELFDLAESGMLRQREVLDRKLRSMLDDAEVEGFVTNFGSQWLGLSGVDRVAVNPEFHPNFDERLKGDMRRETLGFILEVLRKDESALQLIDSDFTVVNRRLARHYNIDQPVGSRFDRVALKPGDRRGGLLAHGAILLAGSDGNDSHPIRRAVWVLDRLLDSPPAPPPPDVPELDASDPDFTKLSLAEQLAEHRTKPSCNSCHRGIDPWGLAFENYDAVGRWRDRVDRKIKRRKTVQVPVNSKTKLPNGTEIDGLDGLKKALLGPYREKFARSLVKRLLSYACGRSMGLADEDAIDELTDKFAANGYKLKQLLVDVVHSEPFRSK
ncbi:MAG: DUF1592 domain-containing protein, partial [Planctomycetota bacterium]